MYATPTYWAQIDYLSLGCPHDHIDEIRRIADFLDGRHIHPDTLVHIWTAAVLNVPLVTDLEADPFAIIQVGDRVRVDGDNRVAVPGDWDHEKLKMARMRDMIEIEKTFVEALDCTPMLHKNMRKLLLLIENIH